METFDGKSMIIDNTWHKPDAFFSTDASLHRCVGWSNPDYFSAPFPDKILTNKNVHINELEITTTLIAIKMLKRETKQKFTELLQ